jgi:hypothetical protein
VTDDIIATISRLQLEKNRSRAVCDCDGCGRQRLCLRMPGGRWLCADCRQQRFRFSERE